MTTGKIDAVRTASRWRECPRAARTARRRTTVRQVENRNEHERERKRWENLRCPKRASPRRAFLLQHQREHRVQHGEDEIERERCVEHGVVQRIGRPHRQQTEHSMPASGWAMATAWSSSTSAMTPRSMRNTNPKISQGRCASGSNVRKAAVNPSATAARPSAGREPAVGLAAAFGPTRRQDRTR